MFDKFSALLHDMGQLPWLVLLAVWLLAFPLWGLLAGGTMVVLFQVTGSPHFTFHSCSGPVESVIFLVTFPASLLALLLLATRLIHMRRVPGT